MTAVFPDIYLDTTIIRSDIRKDWWDNEKVKWLKTYVNLTDAKIYTSEICISEVLFSHEIAIKNDQTKLMELKEKYLGRVSISDIDLDTEMKYLQEKYDAISIFSSIKPINGAHMRESINRALRKLPPCKEKKEEIRDTAIWLTYIDVLKAGRKCVFVSADWDFDKCIDDHPSAKLYKTLDDFFGDFNANFFQLDIWEDKLYASHPIEYRQSLLKYNNTSDNNLFTFIDLSWTDFEVSKTWEIEHITTDIVCIDHKDDEFIFSFTISFLCWFRLFEDNEDISSSFLQEGKTWSHGVVEEISWHFIYKDKNISIVDNWIKTEIYSISIQDTIDDMAADYYQDYGR